MNQKTSFLLGMKKVSPLVLGVVPFGLICGSSGVEAGISVFGTISMSFVIFAGASQLVVTQLLSNDVSFGIMLLTGVMINLRMLMYSASLSGHLGHESFRLKCGIAYLMTDQAFATSVRAYDDGEVQGNSKAAFYFGAGLFMWFSFCLSTVIGAVGGKTIPSSWELDFAVPLTFIALLVTTIKSRWLLYAAFIGGVLALSLHTLPYNLGLLIGSIGGVGGGFVLERRLRNE